jgi:hypothetical protein
MSKKLITSCTALLALAVFILPAAASASPEITHPTGTRLGTGANITGTNVGEPRSETQPMRTPLSAAPAPR